MGFNYAKLHHKILPRVADRQFVEGHISQGIAGVIVGINRDPCILAVLVGGPSVTAEFLNQVDRILGHMKDVGKIKSNTDSTGENGYPEKDVNKGVTHMDMRGAGADGHVDGGVGEECGGGHGVLLVVVMPEAGVDGLEWGEEWHGVRS